jgi:hypothetical protein
MKNPSINRPGLVLIHFALADDCIREAPSIPWGED